jgi:uncharacterized membrane protein YGL010W
MSTSPPLDRQYKILGALAVAHAALVLLLWLAVFYAEIDVLSGRAWLALVWLWLLWPLALAFHPRRSLKRFVVPTIVGVAVLAPCIPTAYTFTSWAVFGFAP